jgi:hypothetical protein
LVALDKIRYIVIIIDISLSHRKEQHTTCLGTTNLLLSIQDMEKDQELLPGYVIEADMDITTNGIMGMGPL